MINNGLNFYLESNNIISDHQSGFRKNRSTTDQLVRLESYIRNAFVKKRHIVAIFFDLEKAYDTTLKHGILKDIHKIGLKGNLPKFISNFLSNRCVKVKVAHLFLMSMNKNREFHKEVFFHLHCSISRLTIL